MGPGAEGDSRADRAGGFSDKGHSPTAPEQAKLRSRLVMGKGPLPVMVSRVRNRLPGKSTAE